MTSQPRQEQKAGPFPGPGLFARERVWSGAVLVLILAAYGALSWSSLVRKSVTYDEFMHLPVGLSYLRTGDFRLEPFNSPLVRMVEALPAWRSSVNLPLGPAWQDRLAWVFGYEFMYANISSYQDIFLRCRLMTLFLGALVIALAWWWATKLYGPVSGLAAASILAFDPNFMAHSRLVTTDIGATLAYAGAMLCFWALCRRPSLPRTLIAGLALGAALLSKFSSLTLVPLLPLLVLGFKRANSPTLAWRQWAYRIAAVYVLAWAAVCSLYLWKGFGSPLGSFAFRGELFRDLQEILPWRTPVPLPYQCVEGLDIISTKNENALGYLLGTINDYPMPYYYLVAFAVKTPLTTLALLALSLFSLKKSPRFWSEEWFLVVPLVVFFVFVSFFTRLYIGVRYLLPAYPFLAIIASRGFSPLLGKRILIRALLGLLAAGTVVSNLLIYPDYLAYFNVAAGGPQNGYRILADSNLDWGQDLVGLKRYMETEKLDNVCLAYFGSVDPIVYGIKSEFPDKPKECPVLAVSVEFVQGFAYQAVNNYQSIRFPEGEFSYLFHQKPDAVIGYSIWIFDRRKNKGAP